MTTKTDSMKIEAFHKWCQANGRQNIADFIWRYIYVQEPVRNVIAMFNNKGKPAWAAMAEEWIDEQEGKSKPDKVAAKVATALIRPGLLVSLKTSLRGGVHYNKQTIAAETVGAASIAKWETIRTISDAAEHERAVIARGKARAAVTRICCASTFGLLCPESQEGALSVAIAQAQEIANAHNATAACTRLEVYCIVGRVADSDIQAAQAIGSEVRDLLAAMESAVRLADPRAIRDAANKARAVSVMLERETQTKVNAAIGEARSIARKIVASVEESGTVAAGIADVSRLTAIRDARFAVLDSLGEDTYLPPEAIAPLPARSVDLPTVDVGPYELAASAPRNLDLGE